MIGVLGHDGERPGWRRVAIVTARNPASPDEVIAPEKIGGLFAEIDLDARGSARAVIHPE